MALDTNSSLADTPTPTLGQRHMSAAFNVEKLRAAMRKKALSRRQVAIGAGISEATLHKVLRGRLVSENTYLSVAVYVNSQPNVIDPELLESA